jgi:predicted dehydrogenase
VNWLTAGSDAVDWVPNFIERYPAAYLLEMEDFAEAVLHDRPVAVGGEDALAAFTLCLAAESSLREGRPVHLEHEQTATGTLYSTDFAN